MTNEEKRWRGMQELIKGYCNVVKDGLYERWSKFDAEIYNAEISETIGGLLARQATLTMQLASTPQIWNEHVAPMILRCMADAHITLAWILRSPKERSKKYVLYGLGQEKLYIEHLKAECEKSGDDDREMEELIHVREYWLNSQRADFLTEVNVGNWAEVNTRDMAKEVDCEGLYKFVYVPYSSVIHNTWQHISVFNLKRCRNPLHKYHKVPNIPKLYLYPHPDYAYTSAKYISKSYDIFDRTYDIETKTPMPVDWFIEKFNALLDETSEDKCP